jgi:hypothetical protein
MNTVTAYHQLGRFVVSFQHLEEGVNNLLDFISWLSNSDTPENAAMTLSIPSTTRGLTSTDVKASFAQTRNCAGVRVSVRSKKKNLNQRLLMLI